MTAIVPLNEKHGTPEVAAAPLLPQRRRTSTVLLMQQGHLRWQQTRSTQWLSLTEQLNPPVQTKREHSDTRSPNDDLKRMKVDEPTRRGVISYADVAKPQLLIAVVVISSCGTTPPTGLESFIDAMFGTQPENTAAFTPVFRETPIGLEGALKM